MPDVASNLVPAGGGLDHFSQTVWLLAYRPFIDPLPIGNSAGWALLCVPLVILVSVAYKTIKLQNLAELPRQASRLTVQILVFLAAAAVLLWVVTLWA